MRESLAETSERAEVRDWMPSTLDWMEGESQACACRKPRPRLFGRRQTHVARL
jgi:hypothetical protein